MNHLLKYICFVMAISHIAQGQINPGGGILGGVIVFGELYCTPTGGQGEDGPRTPAFPDAVIQLRYENKVVASAITTTQGNFRLSFTPSPGTTIAIFLGRSKVHVVTPLTACNQTLQAEPHLESPIHFVKWDTNGVATFEANQFQPKPPVRN